MDEIQWCWGKISVEDESSLCHSMLPSANKFTLLADLREGADGRVWRACAESGVGCCIKFPMRTQSGKDEVSEREQLAQTEDEAENWHKACGVDSARAVALSGRPALIMQYLRPLELRDGKPTGENQAAVSSAIESFASKGLRHDDLAFRHLGVLSPPRKGQRQGVEPEPEPEVILFDLGRVSEVGKPAVAVAEMMSQLSLMQGVLRACPGIVSRTMDDRK